eukprot:CAMPEP_0198271404 /NCGR_PEP_ID=MMETSP1447-20131203/49033_1 /TAXON_ID=420782 /ORGANISM="Chaetoceros dichaeta, Strain CCMP1751" /LENGTH=145 /DNA_ID=CAMNT_0043963975 /DNA_START=33 /DNA_END=470 /DNA_ORIENTATION=+
MTTLQNTRSLHHVVRKLLLQPTKVKQPRSFWTSITSSPPLSEEVTSSSSIPPESYTFQSIAQEVADEHNLSLAKSKRILNTVFDTIAENLAQKKVVKIKDFGKFSNEHSRERKGYNFSTGEAVDIPAGRRVKFVAYTAIKDTINK